MAMNTLIYPSHYKLMDELTNEQAGLLIKTIGRYQRGEDISIDDVLVKGIWMGIKSDFDIQKQNYEKKVNANRENGKKGGRPRNPKNPSGLLKTQHNPQNLKDKDKDKDKEKDKEKDKNKVYIPSTGSTKAHEVKKFKTIMSEKDFDNVML
jgi:hypothetical protein